MAIDVTSLDPENRDEWNRYVERSPEATVFHRQEFFDVIEKHSDATVSQLVGYKGDEPVGLFPVFQLKKGPVSTAFSPPPRLSIPYLGPAMLGSQQAKQRSLAQTNKEFIRGCIELVEAGFNPSYFLIKTTTRFSDPRPFQWEGFDTTPHYTYTLPLTKGADELKRGFSRSLRRYLDPSPEDEVSVEERGPEAIDFVIDLVDERYTEQGKNFTVGEAFVHDLQESLPDGWVRVYVGVVDGADVSGVITLESPDCIYFLQGATAAQVGYPINDLIHWHVVRDACERGIPEYDLMGASVESISQYKAKFNPTLKMYLELERGTWPMQFASNVYRWLR